MSEPDGNSLEDAWMEMALEEVVGGAAPPDLAARHRSAVREPGPRIRRTPQLLATAAFLILGIGAVIGIVAISNGPETKRPTAPDAVASSAEPIRVLYIDGEPRWEFRFLTHALVQNPRLAARTFLCDPESDFEPLCSSGLSPLRSMPRSLASFVGYDVILIGDLIPAQLGASDAERASFWQDLTTFIERGGGVGWIAGARAMPNAYAGTALEPILPVTIDADPNAEIPERVTIATTALSRDRATHAITRLLTEPAPGATTRRPDHFELTARVRLGALRDGMVALLTSPARDPDPSGSSPWMAAGQHGEGRIWIVAVDLWPLRSTFDPSTYDALWERTIVWLGGRE